jgi:hypothetical protein
MQLAGVQALAADLDAHVALVSAANGGDGGNKTRLLANLTDAALDAITGEGNSGAISQP